MTEKLPITPSVKELCTTAFPDPAERAEFLNSINMLNDCQGFVWHWYGLGGNGKTTLVRQLLKEFGSASARQIDENVFMINGNTLILHNENVNQKEHPNELITFFSNTF